MNIRPGVYLASIVCAETQRINEKGVFRLVLEITDSEHAGDIVEVDLVYSGPSKKQNEWCRKLIRKLFSAARVPFSDVNNTGGLEGQAVVVKTNVWAGRVSAVDFMTYSPTLQTVKKPQPNQRKGLSILDENRDYGATIDYAEGDSNSFIRR